MRAPVRLTDRLSLRLSRETDCLIGVAHDWVKFEGVILRVIEYGGESHS